MKLWELGAKHAQKDVPREDVCDEENSLQGSVHILRVVLLHACESKDKLFLYSLVVALWVGEVTEADSKLFVELVLTCLDLFEMHLPDSFNKDDVVVFPLDGSLLLDGTCIDGHVSVEGTVVKVKDGFS